MPEELNSASKEIEVIRDMCDCPDCKGGMVHDIERSPASAGFWTAVLRCPECEYSTLGFYTQNEVDKFDERLLEGMVELELAADITSKFNMREEGNKFILALRAGHIFPADF